MSNVRDEIRRFILEEFLPGESAANLKDAAPLRSEGVLDSMGTLKLVSHLEDTYAIRIEAHETGPDIFNRIDDIVALVERKRAGG